VISNLSNEVSRVSAEVGADSSLQKDISVTKSKITQIYNKMLNWNGYYSYFEFYVPYSLKNEYVPSVRRDYNLLEKESI
jgi:hypothetical protein